MADISIRYTTIFCILTKDIPRWRIGTWANKKRNSYHDGPTEDQNAGSKSGKQQTHRPFPAPGKETFQTLALEEAAKRDPIQRSSGKVPGAPGHHSGNMRGGRLACELR